VTVCRGFGSLEFPDHIHGSEATPLFTKTPQDLQAAFERLNRIASPFLAAKLRFSQNAFFAVRPVRLANVGVHGYPGLYGFVTDHR
jgi:hypothetical protein